MVSRGNGRSCFRHTVILGATFSLEIAGFSGKVAPGQNCRRRTIALIPCHFPDRWCCAFYLAIWSAVACAIPATTISSMNAATTAVAIRATTSCGFRPRSPSVASTIDGSLVTRLRNVSFAPRRRHPALSPSDQVAPAIERLAAEASVRRPFTAGCLGCQSRWGNRVAKGR